MTITLTRDEAQKMLHYMDDGGDYTDNYGKLIEMLRARLSQCERCGEENPAEIHTCTPQEPVAYLTKRKIGGTEGLLRADMVDRSAKNQETHDFIPLYTAPPQREECCAECGKKSSDGWALYCVKCSETSREWQGLTDEEKKAIYEKADAENWHDQPLLEAVEAKLKEKNA
jgi:hypothetical protein